jgi:nicotinate phosphoribosyltransferase
MIINSLLDTDLYKLTMMQSVLHNAPSANVEYRFINRDSQRPLGYLANQIEHQLDHLCSLKFTKRELDYLRSFRFFKPEFLEFLRLFQLNRDFISAKDVDGQLELTISGPWLHTIMFEVPVLAIISEVYFNQEYPEYELTEAIERLNKKIEVIETAELSANYRFSDFGTRRRFRQTWQATVVQTLKNRLANHFVGTSNVMLAMMHEVKPLGTMAHEYFQAYQALGSRLADSQKAALQSWANEYRGDLGIALSDIYGIDAFLRDFDLYFCKLFDGVRHDSGDPIEWGEKVIAHYKHHGIDPSTKTLVFSDSLTIDKTLELYHHFSNQVKVSFGIGTKLTNDVGLKPLNIVIKMTRCNQQPVAKISDAGGKVICDDPQYLDYVRHVFAID